MSWFLLLMYLKFDAVEQLLVVWTSIESILQVMGGLRHVLMRFLSVPITMLVKFETSFS